MKIYVTRHGQTDWNVQGKTQGRADIELNEVGIKQAKQTKEELKNIDIDLIICSPLKRAKKTAEIINEGRNIPIIFDDQIIERNFGEFEGEKIKFDEFWDYNAHPRYQRAETIQEIISRISNFLDKIKEEYKDKNVLLVTHGCVSIAINCYFKGIPEDGKLINYCLHNCEVQEFEI
ncbi:MAG: histidine phosphatase family protein [Clostridia bacterium]